MNQSTEILATIESVLQIIIDEWYDKVSDFYITSERIAEDEALASKEEELKRFHDKNGHRIKFSKDELDFTYGLRAYWQQEDLVIEVSVNNKVKNFDIDEFMDKLESHYFKAGQNSIPTPYELKSYTYSQIFELQSNFGDAFKLEMREGKADIMRLSFLLDGDILEKMAARPVSSKELVENYCVTPFRSIYASVYRRSS